jgi:hypothetical protein
MMRMGRGSVSQFAQQAEEVRIKEGGPVLERRCSEGSNFEWKRFRWREELVRKMCCAMHCTGKYGRLNISAY